MINITNEEYTQFKDFIHKLLYKIMTLEDYEIIMKRLGCSEPIKSNSNTYMYKTLCHNVNCQCCKNNLAFYIDSRSFYCFSECQRAFNIITLVEKRFDLLGTPKTKYQCVKWICEELNIPFNFIVKEDTRSKVDKYNWQSSLTKYLRIKNKETELKSFDKNILNYFENVYHQSWIDDHISTEVMSQYGIKYYPYHDSIIIPCLDIKGNLCGIRERFLNPNTNAKYLPLSMLDGTSYQFPVNQTLYGLNYNAENIRRKKKVVIGESEKFTLQCATYFGCNNFSVSLYGKSMSNTKLRQIIELEPEEVIIGLDFDYEQVEKDDGSFTSDFESFKKNVYRIGNYFRPYCQVSAMISYSGHNKNDSPTDKGKEWYLELFNQREKLYNKEGEKND